MNLSQDNKTSTALEMIPLYSSEASHKFYTPFLIQANLISLNDLSSTPTTFGQVSLLILSTHKLTMNTPAQIYPSQ